jgi:hypothetical protein
MFLSVVLVVGTWRSDADWERRERTFYNPFYIIVDTSKILFDVSMMV